MCKALEIKTTPIKDLPVDKEAEADWRHPSKKLKAKEPADDKQQKQLQDQSISKARSLFEKFKLAELFAEVDAADQQGKFEQTIAFSSKITFLMTLMKNLRAEGHRVLIFSMSKKILNIIEAIL